MPDRRIKECNIAEDIAAAKLDGMQLRAGDPSKEDVERAMLTKLQEKYGKKARREVQPRAEMTDPETEEGTDSGQQEPATTAVERNTGDIEAALGALSERYMGVDVINEALSRLEGVRVQIPEDEVARLKGLLPAELTDAHKEAITKLQEACENNVAPLMMQLPEKITVDGKERPFTIATMYEVMQKAKKMGSLPKPLWLSGYVLQATKDQKWGGELGVWTSKCLKGSKDKKYKGRDGQPAYQKQVLGEDHEIHADMILAMALRYIQTDGKDEVMRYMRDGFMRLNDTDSDGYPLYVGVGDYDLGLDAANDSAYSDSGIGGSLRISS